MHKRLPLKDNSTKVKVKQLTVGRVFSRNVKLILERNLERKSLCIAKTKTKTVLKKTSLGLLLPLAWAMTVCFVHVPNQCEHLLSLSCYLPVLWKPLQELLYELYKFHATAYL